MANNPNGINDDSKHNQETDEPEFIPSRPGRMVTLQGLVERIVEQFNIEHGEDKSDVIRNALTDIERRKLVRDTANYVFSVESVQLSPHEQAQIIGRAIAEIFGYGPLQELLEDNNITTISLEGVQKVSVRYAPATELQVLNPIFENIPQMRRIIKRLLRHAGAEIKQNIPIIETGLTIANRRVSLSVATPPFVPEMAVDIRLHPENSPALDDWLQAGILTHKVRILLEAIVKSEHGLVIVGDTESGKTTLLSMLLQTISGDDLLAVERTGELLLPENSERLVTQWAKDDDKGMTFGEQINAALERQPTTLVLDEVRTDEPTTIAPLLANADVPRQIWTFRGTSDAKRLKSALGMLARMADNTQSEKMVTELYRRLPFIVIIKRRKERLQVIEVAEWQFPHDNPSDENTIYADYIPLMQMGWEQCEVTGKRPHHQLNLPDNFWDK